MKFNIAQTVKCAGHEGAIVGTHTHQNGFGPIGENEYAVRFAGGVALRYADELTACADEAIVTAKMIEIHTDEARKCAADDGVEYVVVLASNGAAYTMEADEYPKWRDDDDKIVRRVAPDGAVTTPVDHIEVFYVGGTTGWAVGRFDAEGNQMEECAYSWRKYDTIRVGYIMALAKYPIHIHKRDGELQRVVTPTATRKD